MDLRDLEERVGRNPYGMVAGAIGIGFVLGGGLFTRMTARIVGAGLRIGLMAALPLLKNELLKATNLAVTAATVNNDEGESR
jgi:hypothetical protein